MAGCSAPRPRPEKAHGQRLQGSSALALRHLPTKNDTPVLTTRFVNDIMTRQSAALDDLLQFTLQGPRYDVPHTVFDQQAHGTVDQAGGKAFGPACRQTAVTVMNRTRSVRATAMRRRKSPDPYTGREVHHDMVIHRTTPAGATYFVLAKINVFHHDKAEPLGKAEPVTSRCPISRTHQSSAKLPLPFQPSAADSREILSACAQFYPAAQLHLIVAGCSAHISC